MEEKDKELLESVATSFYNSVEDKFNYQIKNQWKFDLSIVLFVASLLFAFFHVLPISLKLGFTHLEDIYNLSKGWVGLDHVEYSFNIGWVTGILISILIFLPFYLIRFYWRNRERKNGIDSRYLTFCYSFKMLSEVRKYLINGDEQHLSRIERFLDEVIAPLYQVQIEGKSIDIDDLEEKIKDLHWFSFTDKSKWFIESILSLYDRVIERIDERAEIEKTIPTLESLALHEFSKIRPDQLDNNGMRLGDRQIELLEISCQKANELGVFNDKKSSDSHDKMSRIKVLMKWMASCFSGKNLIVTFISWLVLFTFTFVLPCIGILMSLRIDLDSTLITGLISSPFLGAVTITATIYSKRK